MGTPRQKPKRLADKLLAIRKTLGLSQSQLAKALGVTTGGARISEWENAKREPDLVTVMQYARLVRIKMEMLADDDLELIIPKRRKRTSSNLNFPLSSHHEGEPSV